MSKWSFKVKKNIFLVVMSIMLIMLFLLFSCSLDGIFKGSAVFSGDVKTFIENGYSIPVYGDYGFTGSETPIINDTKMFQTGKSYSFTMDIANPKGLTLDYSFETENPEYFDVSTDSNTIFTGSLSGVNNTITFPFKLKNEADKKNVKMKLLVSSSLRPYETPDISAIYVNTRPSKIIPCADAAGGELTNDIWEPLISGGIAHVYWNYIPLPTDTDISHLEVVCQVGENTTTGKFLYDASSKKFGTNSFSVEDVPQKTAVNISIIVYDDEGLDSGYVSTGNFEPQRAGLPVFKRAGNLITITPYKGSFVNYKIDDGNYLKSTDVVLYTLTKTHTITAYSSRDDLYSSEPLTMNYTAIFTVTFDSQGSDTQTPTPVETEYNTSISVPSEPSRNGYIFAGWYRDLGFTTLWNFSDKVTDYLTLYAKWIKKGGVNITFVTEIDYKSLVFTPSASTAIQGSSVTISSSGGISGASGWRWYVNGILMTNQTSSAFVFDTTAKVGDYVISCTVKIDGVIYSGSVKITVKN